MTLVRKFYSHPYRYALFMVAIVFFFFNEKSMAEFFFYVSLSSFLLFSLITGKVFSHLFFSQIYQIVVKFNRTLIHSPNIKKRINLILLCHTTWFFLLPVADLFIINFQVWTGVKPFIFILLLMFYLYSVVVSLKKSFKISHEQTVWLFIKNSLYLGLVSWCSWLLFIFIW